MAQLVKYLPCKNEDLSSSPLPSCSSFPPSTSLYEKPLMGAAATVRALSDVKGRTVRRDDSFLFYDLRSRDHTEVRFDGRYLLYSLCHVPGRGLRI